MFKLFKLFGRAETTSREKPDGSGVGHMIDKGQSGQYMQQCKMQIQAQVRNKCKEIAAKLAHIQLFLKLNKEIGSDRVYLLTLSQPKDSGVEHLFKQLARAGVILFKHYYDDIALPAFSEDLQICSSVLLVESETYTSLIANFKEELKTQLNKTVFHIAYKDEHLTCVDINSDTAIKPEFLLYNLLITLYPDKTKEIEDIQSWLLNENQLIDQTLEYEGLESKLLELKINYEKLKQNKYRFFEERNAFLRQNLSALQGDEASSSHSKNTVSEI